MQPYVNNKVVLDTVRLENNDIDDLSTIKDLQSIFRVNETKNDEDDRDAVEIYDQMYEDFMEHRDNDEDHEKS
jgi:hypothetical protein